MKRILLLLFLLLLLVGCKYKPSDSDIVVGLSTEITNIVTFEQFLRNVEEGKKDEIRIVSYTEEGDPIIQDVKFDGKTIVAKTDTTRDKFGTGKVESISCKSIGSKKSTDSEKSVEYFLSDCELSQPEDDLWVHLLTVYEKTS
ncbi:MAG: DUF4362 domain-containing protein [Anaerobacillus sp.]